MSLEIVLPALSPTMTAGTLARWHKAVGDAVKIGEVVAEVETDKAAVDIESPADGVLADILVQDGALDVPVNTVIGHLRALGAAPSPLPPPASEAQDAAGCRRVSPLARRLARDQGVALDGIDGSGPGGRILAQDIIALTQAGIVPAAPELVVAATVAPAAPTAPMPPAIAAPDAEALPHDAMRLAIARRLSDAKRDVPHFYATVRCRVDALLALRQTLNAALAAEGEDATRLTVNDFLVKALALALRRTPEANVTYRPDSLLRHRHPDIGVAVALENGLITPILRHADMKSITALAGELRDMISRAKLRKLHPEEFIGGTAGISNLGMHGVSEFAAIVNPPQSLNLAVGAIESRLILAAGAPVEIKEVALTVSVDHRAIDGVTAARLLAEIRGVIETPVLLLS